MERVSAEFKLCRHCRRAKRVNQLERRGRHYYRCLDRESCEHARREGKNS